MNRFLFAYTCIMHFGDFCKGVNKLKLTPFCKIFMTIPPLTWTLCYHKNYFALSIPTNVWFNDCSNMLSWWLKQYYYYSIWLLTCHLYYSRKRGYKVGYLPKNFELDWTYGSRGVHDTFSQHSRQLVWSFTYILPFTLTCSHKRL